MKRIFYLTAFLVTFGIYGLNAQNYALIDMEYILKRIPEYKEATDKIDAMSKQWQADIDAEIKTVEALYKSYQNELPKLTAAKKAEKEKEIVKKENSIKEMRNSFFGPQGEMFKQQEQLIQPIQDAIYEAAKQVASDQGYAMIIDRASAKSIIFANPSIDVSEEVLAKLGY